jgi:uncharacterized protein YodC (DUF2158 family)
MIEIEPGDIVRMRGDPDNPLMLVQHVGDYVSCAWFDGNKTLTQAGFAPEYLMTVDIIPTRATILERLAAQEALTKQKDKP